MEEISISDIKPGEIIQHYICFPENFIVLSKYLIPTENDINRVRQFNLVNLFFNEDELPFIESVQGTKEDITNETTEITSSIEQENGKLHADIEKILKKPDADTELVEKKDTGTNVATEGESVLVNEKSSGLEQKVSEPEIQIEKDVESVKSQLNRANVTIYGSIVSILHKEFDAISKGNKIEVNKMLKIASILLGYVSNVKEEALLHIARGRDSYRIEVHAVNVGILASLISLSLQIKGSDLVNIVAGAVMHDIGILLLPDTHNSATLKEHTMYGFRYLKSIKNVDPLLVVPSLQHHEKARGDGYPNKLILNNIELSSRITTVCDSIDNQISFIKYGNDISIHFTKDEFLIWKKEDFDPKIFLASINAITNIFKIDSVVLLNNGYIALIKKINIRFPLNPVVQIVADKDGNKITDQRIIDLIRTKDVWLSKFVKRA